jgi:hypothetical protein
MRACQGFKARQQRSNMLMVPGPHTARGNIPQAIEHSVQFPTGMLRFMFSAIGY